MFIGFCRHVDFILGHLHQNLYKIFPHSIFHCPPLLYLENVSFKALLAKEKLFNGSLQLSFISFSN